MKLSRQIQNVVSWFAQSLIAGNLGPDDSHYSRDQSFLKHPHIVGQAIAIFLYRLEVNDSGRVLNHEEAEERVRAFIRWKMAPEEMPEPQFNYEELGIR